MKITAAGETDHAKADHRGDQGQIRGQHFVQRHATQRHAQHHDWQRADDEDAQVAEGGQEFSQDNRRRPQGTGQQAFVGLAFFFAADGPRRETGSHQGGQQVLAQEEEIHPLLCFDRGRHVHLPKIGPGHPDDSPQQPQVDQQQQERAVHPQVAQQFAL